MKKTKLNYRFHNPNSAEDTADFLCKLLIEANRGKVERAMERAALQDEESDAYINNAAGQTDVPNKPLTEGAYISIYSGDENFCMSDSNSRFDVTSAKYLHADSVTNVIRPVYNKNGGNHTYKIYYNNRKD